MPKCGVYKILCCNGFKYYGRSKNIPSRLCAHKSLLRKNKHPNKKMQNDFNEFGESGFTFSILKKTSTYYKACILERKILSKKISKKCYNKSSLVSLQDSPMNHTEEMHLNLSKEMMENVKNEATKENRSFAAQIRHILQLRYIRI